MRRARIRLSFFGITLLAASAASGQNAPGNGSLENAKQLTVMINATIDRDTRPGAGIIFGLANNQIYIATANHLVRRGLAKANDIQVEFQWLPGEPVPAQLLTYYDDRALDLALLVVDSSKAHLPRTGLPEERFGDPRTLTRDSAVFAIGYPDGNAFDVSAAHISQVEAVSLKYRVAGLVPGGYSGGPLVDRNGMIMGMIRQDQPPDGEATRIDLVVDQLKAWNYQVRLGNSPGGTEAASKPPGTSTRGDPFRDVLSRYIAEAPSGFRALGAKQFGNWAPSVNLPDAVSCRGGGTSKEPFIECVLYRTDSEAEAADKFEDLIDLVQTALPDWKGSRMNMFNAFFRKTQDNSNGLPARPLVNVNLGVTRSGDNFSVTLSVRRFEQ